MPTPLIRDLDDHLLARTADSDPDVSSGVAELDGVADQVAQDLNGAQAVSVYGETGYGGDGEGQTLVFRYRTKLLFELAEDAVDLYSLDVHIEPARVEAGHR